MIQHAQDTCVRFNLYHCYVSSKEPSEQRKYEDALAVIDYRVACASITIVSDTYD